MSRSADTYVPMKKPYLYEGLEAKLYDELDELSGFDDFPFYHWFANANQGRILDLGCGTGRTLVPFAREGADIVGLEYSETMIEICKANLEKEKLQAEIVRGDMTQFDLGENRFDTVMIPGYTIQLLMDDESVLGCLKRCREHLSENGQVIVSTYMPWDMIWDEADCGEMQERKMVRNPENGETLQALQGWKLDSHKQHLILSNRIERKDGAGALLAEEEKTMTIRWHLPHDMLRILAASGFNDVSMYGDFGFDPPEDDSESIIYVARP